MNELQRLRDTLDAKADKLDREHDYLQQLLDPAIAGSAVSPESAALIVSQAKRVRSMSSDVVKLVAQLRDNLQA